SSTFPLAPQSPRMRDEDKINCAHEIDEAARRARQAKRSLPKRGKHVRDRQLGRTRDAGVMGAERVQAMSVRCGDERLFEFSRDGCGAPIRIKETRPEMAELYRIETMDSLYQLFAHRTAQHIEWVRRDREHRLAAARAQSFEIVKIPERFDVLRRDIEQNNIRAFEPHFRGGDEENSHASRICENFRAIEDRVV